MSFRINNRPKSLAATRWITASIAALIGCAVPSTACADLVKLINGGELRGKIIRTGESKQLIRLETMTGALVVVERAQTQFVTMRSLNVEEYETRSRRLQDTWEAHWELAEWCRQHSLSRERETHLRRVTELSPEHQKAQVALGRVWHEGSWVDRDELMTSRGYVKYKNKYITPQELEVIQNTADELASERSWFSKIRVWYGWLDSTSDDRARRAVSEFQNIDDPNAAAALLKILGPDSRVEVRELCVSVLTRISGSKAVVGLVKFALFDDADKVRSLAMNGIGQDHYQHAQDALVKALDNDDNAVLCRAATALGQIGNKDAIKPLIEVLVTEHHYSVPADVSTNQTYSFTTDGNFGSTNPTLPPSVMAAVRTGQMLPPVVVPQSDIPKKHVTIRVEHYNAEVLAALGKLTQQNFGYDKRTWSLWWAADKNQGSKNQK